MPASVCALDLSTASLACHDFGLESRHFSPALFHIKVKIKAPLLSTSPGWGPINLKAAKSEVSGNTFSVSCDPRYKQLR